MVSESVLGKPTHSLAEESAQAFLVLLVDGGVLYCVRAAIA
jgi:hypothetical protein